MDIEKFGGFTLTLKGWGKALFIWCLNGKNAKMDKEYNEFMLLWKCSGYYIINIIDL